MIVCVCKSVSDRTIRSSIADGIDSFDELQFELGVASCCGKCAESVRDVMMQSGVCASRCGVEYHQTNAVPLTFYERKAA
ncbi:bacterioferritin-associated ferredoxin [Paraburkholderia fungorum]|jgi:bacterioferritin-associated ferredoxin|uniref:Bacterioferritin-associated ferredoxin n=1 Tax=Paraburkholderia fungorum TaxID=134537 RepID=A0A1H1AUF9_9BURK|nr:(2Fe-2S)-binding protein [Paraburkholderia fungorum]SDQ43319.1 bacterioferritin-associated ferredoxin [Paraburkholderia fungorum]